MLTKLNRYTYRNVTTGESWQVIAADILEADRKLKLQGINPSRSQMACAIEFNWRTEEIMSIKRTEGRLGGPLEFVEFKVRDTAIVAQKGAGGFWFVFKVSRSGVTTLDQFEDKERAVAKAQEIAETL